MTSIPRSGLLCSNRFARITLQSLIDVAGENGMHAVFRLAGLPGLIESLPPENDLREFDTADLAAVFQTIAEIYGIHGSRSLAYKAGQMTFTAGLEVLDPAYGLKDLPLVEKPIGEKVQIGLAGIRAAINRFSDQQIDLFQGETNTGWTFAVHDCGICQGRHSSEPVCTFTIGLLEQALFHISGGSKFQILESSCIAAGGDACTYVIQIPEPENPPFTV